jgi:hypothetical protein
MLDALTVPDEGHRLKMPFAGVRRSGRGQLGLREMSDLSPKSDPKRTLLRPQSPITIYEYTA